MPATKTTRLDAHTNDLLDELRELTGRNGVELLRESLERLRADIVVARMNAGYARLRDDSAAWAQELAERQILDGTLSDGLDREPGD
jgi:hypothetical protein